MKHLYLFTLEIVPLTLGKTYDNLPSHLTLMSRFLSELSPETIANAVQPVFASAAPVQLAFNETIKLGPKKVMAHMVSSSAELRLHERLLKTLDAIHVEYQYPEFIGGNHKAHVTQRPGHQYDSGYELTASTAYLIEIVDKKRVVRTRFTLNAA